MLNYNAINRAKLYEIIAANVYENPALNLLEWSERYRFLSPEASATAGRFKAKSYQKEILTTMSDKRYKKVVLMLASQLGKTEMCLNLLAYKIVHQPAPVLFMLPDEGLAEDFSKRRFAPMRRDNSALRAALTDAAGDTILIKNFAGGSLNFVGSNSVSKLASKPIETLIVDEADRCSNTAEGDSIALAQKRTVTFKNAKVILVSTPTLTGSSKIAAEYNNSDQRKFYLQCPHCSDWVILKWSQIDLDSSSYICEFCKKAWSEAQRREAIKNGEWRAGNPASSTAGFWLSSLYAEHIKLEDIVQEYKEKKDNELAMQVFVNTTLAECYTPRAAASLDINELKRARLDYVESNISDKITTLTAAIDIQNDRLELNIAGFYIDEAQNLVMHNIKHYKIMQDPRTSLAWLSADKIIKDFEAINKAANALKVRAVCVDSGFLTDRAYAFVKGKRGYFATKGANESGNNKKKLIHAIKLAEAGVARVEVGTFAGKSELFAMIKNNNFKLAASYSDEYIEQLAAESLKVITNKYNETTLRFTKDAARNEAIDLSVLNIAAFKLIDKKKRKK